MSSLVFLFPLCFETRSLPEPGLTDWQDWIPPVFNTWVPDACCCARLLAWALGLKTQVPMFVQQAFYWMHPLLPAHLILLWAWAHALCCCCFFCMCDLELMQTLMVSFVAVENQGCFMCSIGQPGVCVQALVMYGVPLECWHPFIVSGRISLINSFLH